MEDCGIDYRFLREGNQINNISGRYTDPLRAVKLKGQLTLLKELFQALGLVINWEKSQFEPTQEILFLGFWISTKSMTASLPREKLRKIMQEAHQLSQRASVSLQEIAGKTTAAITILIRTDNVATMAYINHLGGTHSPLLNDLAAQL